MSFKSDCKNASIRIKNEELRLERRMTKIERKELLRHFTPWGEAKIEKVLVELYE